jgi:hypothetical protein
LKLDETQFRIKLKRIDAPTDWVYDQLHKNFASPWLDLGTAQWQGNSINVMLPENINDL